MIEQSVNEPLFVGIDGGGTGCRARIENAEGVVYGSGLAGPAATRLGVERSWASIKAAFLVAAEEAGLSNERITRLRAGIGVAGLSRRGALEAFQQMPHPFSSIVFASDVVTACVGAHSGRDGGIVIVGTGSSGVARVNGREFRVGGYGFPISDEGSGADLGLKAIQLALRAFDDRHEWTSLLREVMSRFQNDPPGGRILDGSRDRNGLCHIRSDGPPSRGPRRLGRPPNCPERGRKCRWPGARPAGSGSAAHCVAWWAVQSTGGLASPRCASAS